MVHTETSRESEKVDTDSHNGRSHLREILLSHTPGGAFNNAHMNKQNVKESCGMFCWICDLGCPSKSEQRCYCSCVDAFLRVSSQKCYLSNSSVASNKDEEFSSDLEKHELDNAFVMMSRMLAEYTEFNNSIQPPNTPTINESVPPIAPGVQSPYTVQWLMEHYEERAGISLQRNAMYIHYLDHCHTANLPPVNAASFGKILRSVFPNVRTRRLGNRGHSKYHYYGITIKDSSLYKNVILQQQRINNFVNENPNGTDNSRTVSLQHRPFPCDNQQNLQLSECLPQFPDVNKIKLPIHLYQKTRLFLMLYSQHMRGLLELVIQAELNQVGEHIGGFWTDLPCHLRAILTSAEVVSAVALCDCLVYEAVSDILIPNLMQQMTNDLQKAIRRFAKDVTNALTHVLQAYPEMLQQRLVEMASQAEKMLCRKVSLVRIIMEAKKALSINLGQTREDWLTLESNGVLECSAMLQWSLTGRKYKIAQKYLAELGRLVTQGSSIERYIAWLDTLLKIEVTQKCERYQLVHRQVICSFLMKWNMMMATVTKEISVAGLPSAGTFLLLSILFTDYIKHVSDKTDYETTQAELRQTVYSTSGTVSGSTTRNFGTVEPFLLEENTESVPISSSQYSVSTQLPENIFQSPPK